MAFISIMDSVIKRTAEQLKVPETEITLETVIPDIGDLATWVAMDTGKTAIVIDLHTSHTVEQAITEFEGSVSHCEETVWESETTRPATILDFLSHPNFD